VEPCHKSGNAELWQKFLVVVFFYPFLIIALAGDQYRQLMPNSTRHVAILWQFLDIAAQILCASRCINIGGFLNILDRRQA
jgi:hypothetical protein